MAICMDIQTLAQIVTPLVQLRPFQPCTIICAYRSRSSVLISSRITSVNFGGLCSIAALDLKKCCFSTSNDFLTLILACEQAHKVTRARAAIAAKIAARARVITLTLNVATSFEPVVARYAQIYTKVTFRALR